MRSLLAIPVVALLLVACGDYPRDTEGSLRHIRSNGVLRAGISQDPPYVMLTADGEPQGSEVELLRRLAQAQGARIEWVQLGHERLMKDLLAVRVHVVAGGFVPDSPWDGYVVWSRRYPLDGDDGRTAVRRLALPPGENAWHLAVDRFLLAREADAETGP